MRDELRIYYITMQQLLAQKFKDLESLLHSFPSSPAVACSGLWCILRWSAVWSAVICGGLWFSDLPVLCFHGFD